MATDRAPTYDPTAQYESTSYDVEYRRDGNGPWSATVFQPKGKGPFPALLDIHGGAWNRGSRASNAPIDTKLAESGLVVVAIDFRLAPEHPYPAQVADVNYATRWLKAHAADFNATPQRLGGIGSSSGGHTIMLSAMRPHDPRYASLELPEAQDVNASLAYVVALWSVLDPYARYRYAQRTGYERLVTSTENYFINTDTMKEGNPQHLLERRENVELPPIIIVHGTQDENIPSEIPERFAVAYNAAGGSAQLESFPGMPHGFAREPGPESDRAIELIKAFIAYQLGAEAGAVMEAG